MCYVWCGEIAERQGPLHHLQVGGGGPINSTVKRSCQERGKTRTVVKEAKVSWKPGS